MAKQNNRQRDQRRLRAEEMRRAQAARERRNRILMVAGSFVLAAGVVAGGWWAVSAAKGDGETRAAESEQIEPDKANIKGEKVFAKLGRNHVPGEVDYPSLPALPPAGGDHNAIWQNGNGDVYTEPLPNEHAVHTLEHGAVWVTYGKDTPKAEIEAMADKVEGKPYRFMSPLPDQKGAIVLTAWGHQLTVKNAKDKRIDEFFDAYVQGPQTPEPGAAVTGGRAEP